MAKRKTSKSRKTSSKKTPSKNRSVRFDYDHVVRIIELMKENDVTEFEWKDQDSSLYLSTGATTRTRGFREVVTEVAATASTPVASAPAAAKPAAASATPPNTKEVISPFVGTFYRSSSPGANPYTSEGERVRPGDILCIVEAMKLMNEIECEVEGTISKVLVENGQPVEFGEPLFLVDTSSTPQ